MSWAWVRTYRVSRRLKKEWAAYLASTENLEQIIVDDSNNKNIGVGTSARGALNSTYLKLDIFLKDFIDSLSDTVEQSKKSQTAFVSVDAIYGDCQTLLLDLVKASKRIVHNMNIKRKQNTNNNNNNHNNNKSKKGKRKVGKKKYSSKNNGKNQASDTTNIIVPEDGSHQKISSEEELLLNCLKAIQIILMDKKYLKLAATHKMVSKIDLEETLNQKVSGNISNNSKNNKNGDDVSTIKSRYLLHEFMKLMKVVPFVESRILLLTIINNIAEEMEDKSSLSDIKGIDKTFRELLKIGNEKLSKEVLRTVKIFVIDRQLDIPTNNVNFSTNANDSHSISNTNSTPKLSDTTIAERVLSSIAPWMGSWGSGIVGKHAEENSDENSNNGVIGKEVKTNILKKFPPN